MKVMNIISKHIFWLYLLTETTCKSGETLHEFLSFYPRMTMVIEFSPSLTPLIYYFLFIFSHGWTVMDEYIMHAVFSSKMYIYVQVCKV